VYCLDLATPPPEITHERDSIVRSLTLALGLCGLLCAGGALAAEDLGKGFSTPPASARPWVYWFWSDGNLSREGITADLEAMHRVGIGGVLIMEVDQGIPKGPARFASPKWRELFKFMVGEAARLGIEVDMNNDAGWCGSGGPWVKPEHAMQKVVATETAIEGPVQFQRALPQPPAVAGYYRDIAVLAFPTPPADADPKRQVRIDHLAGKTALVREAVGTHAAYPALPSDATVARDRIIDLTSHLAKDGRLTWDVPAGKWTILRLGYTPTGAVNAPSPMEGRGLECDKLAKEAMDEHFDGLMGKLIADVGPAAGKALTYTHIDSWEVHSQNWTPRMREEFKSRRGYDPLPFLPAMTGRVVDSLEVSERFLWDLRKTIAELNNDNYAGRLQELAHQHGMQLSIEAYGDGVFDDLSYAGRADSPMSEFWVGGGAMETAKAMASAAHTYGKPIVGAESFTAVTQAARWTNHPFSLKSLGDIAFCEGINRFVFHRYSHQPWIDRTPGMTMGPWGVHYERTETWWEQTRPWHEYLARCNYLLRQGLFVADICFLQTENAPNGLSHALRTAYDFDGCTPEVVLTRMSVRDGRLVLPDGMSYRVLGLPPSETMTPALLRKIKELVDAGATVVGARPAKSPSLAGYPQCDAELAKLSTELWGDCDGKAIFEHRCGKGRVVCGKSPDKVLLEQGVPPDFNCESGRSKSLHYIHRTAGGDEIYFVANASGAAQDVLCTFRVKGKHPEYWRPETGRIEPAAMYQETADGIRIPLRLGGSESVFVVFRKAAGAMQVVSLKRDGSVVASASDTAPKLVVRKAVYGVPGQAAETRDVTAKMQQCIDQGERTIIVTSLAKDGDPAPNKIKTLTVDYTIDGKPATERGRDGGVVRLGIQRRNLVVQKATYGVPGDASHSRDVTAKVQKIVDQGEYVLLVSSLAAGDDPAFGTVKTLSLDYTLDGKPCTAKGVDPDYLPLLSDGVRAADLRCADDGSLVLEARKPGRYELKTASGKTSLVNIDALPDPIDVGGPWTVRFPKGWHAPETASLDTLISWSEHPDAGVKYFSGTAAYSKTFQTPQSMLTKDRRIYLDLGRVAVIAEVKVNGKDLGILWRPPYCVDITDAVKAGDNSLEVRVTNLWVNRLIGDEQLPEDCKRHPGGNLVEWPKWLQEGKKSPTGRLTFATWRHWTKDSPLVESGLLGPVTLRATQQFKVQ
jgi:hypothetical protein